MAALDPDGLIQQVLKATWSLEEAAHLVRDVNPVKQSVELSDVSSHPVSLTYFWLKKEYIKGYLVRVAGDAENPRFSPGTLMRCLENKKRFVSPKVRKLYDTAHGHRGPKISAAESKEIYRKAADLIWCDHPEMPAARVATTLVDLPSDFAKKYLPSFSVETIRKWLRGRGPGKPGRPRSGANDPAMPDLGKVVEKLGKN